MTRSEVVRVLYVGGQAAIIAELAAIAGLILFAFIAPDAISTQSRTANSILPDIEDVVEIYRDNRLAFVVGTGLRLIVPTFVMLVVVWAWHLYFSAEGVRLMNLVATSVALIGATMMLTTFGLQGVGIELVAQGLEDGRIGLPNAYMSSFMVFSLERMATACLYGFYPVMLAVASWQKRLLPMWFVAIAVFFASINDINILSIGQDSRLAEVGGIMLVLWPFLMGVVLLRKAQVLANEAYMEEHGTPPPQPTGWRDGWRITPPTTHPQTPTTHLADEALPETQLMPHRKQQD